MVIPAVPLPPALHTQNQIETLCTSTIHAKELAIMIVLSYYIYITTFLYIPPGISAAQSDFNYLTALGFLTTNHLTT